MRKNDDELILDISRPANHKGHTSYQGQTLVIESQAKNLPHSV